MVPQSYVREPWKIYTVDPLEYFAPAIREKLQALNLRQVEPRGGKIDYDVDGKLVGNWFQEGTNGYNGANPSRYWLGHLSLVYDYIDPTHITVSLGATLLGNCQCESKQYGVKGNTPDPKDVSAASGLVKYSLVFYDYMSAGANRSWDRRSPAKDLRAVNQDQRVFGTLLVQLVEERKLKAQYFDGKSAEQVTDFTDTALTFVR